MPVPAQNMRAEWVCESCGYEMKSRHSGSDAVVAPSCPKCGGNLKLVTMRPAFGLESLAAMLHRRR